MSIEISATKCVRSFTSSRKWFFFHFESRHNSIILYFTHKHNFNVSLQQVQVSLGPAIGLYIGTWLQIIRIFYVLWREYVVIDEKPSDYRTLDAWCRAYTKKLTKYIYVNKRVLLCASVYFGRVILLYNCHIRDSYIIYLIFFLVFSFYMFYASKTRTGIGFYNSINCIIILYKTMINERFFFYSKSSFFFF